MRLTGVTTNGYGKRTPWPNIHPKAAHDGVATIAQRSLEVNGTIVAAGW